MSSNELIKDLVILEEASNYDLQLNIVKPNNETKFVKGKLLNEYKSLFLFDLEEDCKDIIGTYTCELYISCKVGENTEASTSDEFSYLVRPSVLNNLDDPIISDEKYPILLNLIKRIEDLNVPDTSSFATKEDVENIAKELGRDTEENLIPLQTTEQSIRGAINELKNNQGSGIGSGLTTSQINALHEMFKVCAYDDSKDISTAYSNFKTAFGIIVEEKTKYAITNNLTKVTTDNTNTEIEEGSIYRANITVDVNCEIETVTVTMGGANITSSCFVDNSIVINEVTGDIVIIIVAKISKVTPESLGYTTLYEYDDLFDKDKVLANENVDSDGILNFGYTSVVTFAYYCYTVDKTTFPKFDIFDGRQHLSPSLRAADGGATGMSSINGSCLGRAYDDTGVKKFAAGFGYSTSAKGKVCLFSNSYNGGITQESNSNICVRLLIIQGNTITESELAQIFEL